MNYLIIGHGAFAQYSRQAVQQLLGRKLAIDVFSADMPFRELQETLRTYLADHDGELMVFADVLIGSATQYLLYMTQFCSFYLFAGLPLSLMAELVALDSPCEAELIERIEKQQQLLRGEARQTQT